MTKPCNFPERKRQRQMRALARLIKNGATYKKSGEPSTEERLALIAAVKNDKRSTRTKKYRGDRGRFSRAA